MVRGDFAWSGGDGQDSPLPLAYIRVMQRCGCHAILPSPLLSQVFPEEKSCAHSKILKCIAFN